MKKTRGPMVLKRSPEILEILKNFHTCSCKSLVTYFELYRVLRKFEDIIQNDTEC